MSEQAAVCKRRLHFEAGPETQTFYACAAHRRALETGDVMCFLPMREYPVEPLSDEDLEDEMACDLCKEG
jgi:hypothetical protein